MKKFIAFALVLVLCLSVFAGCEKDSVEKTSDLQSAKDYVYNTYKNASDTYIADYKVIGKVLVGDKTFAITWTTDAAEENVKIVPGDDGMVTIDINETNPEEVTYTLTATIADDKGNTESVTLNRFTPAAVIVDAGMSYEEIVEAGYKLPEGIAMEETLRLFGTITKIDTPYDANYKNVTVTIQVGDMADKPIMCYRLKGEGADKLAVGDKITVQGILKNYKGTIEFDAGCELLAVGLDAKDPKPVLDAAYSLPEGIAMTEPSTLVGVITKIDTPYDANYKNVTVTIVCEGDEARPMMCYRLKGEGADTLAVGDTIQVTGTIKNYKGTIEFDAGCVVEAIVKSAEEIVAPENPADIVAAAFALPEGGALPYEATLTGEVKSIDNPYNEQYGNVTVTIETEGQLIQCFRLKGDTAATLAVGDKITVTGYIANYKGAVQFGAGCTFVPAA
ncbi:MAG: hypothetical protein IJN53_04355 [Oscillospiraceae bacterium]|nr:hypothetical protein [Oscillospiraceae bacterium]